MRYVVFQLTGQKASTSEARAIVEALIEKHAGRTAMAENSIKFIPERYDPRSCIGLVRTQKPEIVKAALLLSGGYAINIKGVSGTIKGTERFR